MEVLNLPKAGCPHKASDQALESLKWEANNTAVIPLNVFRASVAQMGPPFKAGWGKENAAIEESSCELLLEFAQRYVV